MERSVASVRERLSVSQLLAMERLAYEAKTLAGVGIFNTR
jgi:hypothetical protein